MAGWTNPTYAYNDDGVQFATRTGSAKNTWYGTLYGFNLSGVPDGATINSVTITAEWKNSANDSAGPELMVGRLTRKIKSSEQDIHEAFDLLKEDVDQQIRMLEKVRTKRRLTLEEEKIIRQFKSDLSDAEKYMKKEMEDIRREVS